MKAKRATVYEWFLVVEGSGEFPFDMLRYDSAFPATSEDAVMMTREGTRRVVLCRRGASAEPGTPGRWKSFGWKVLDARTDEHAARETAGMEDA